MFESWEGRCKCDGGSSKEARGRERFIQSARAPSFTSRRWDCESDSVTVFITAAVVCFEAFRDTQYGVAHIESGERCKTSLKLSDRQLMPRLISVLASRLVALFPDQGGYRPQATAMNNTVHTSLDH